MLVAVLGARLLLVQGGVPAGARLALLILLGIVVYVPACLRLDPTLRADIGHLRRRRRSTEPAAALD
jgi:hypothetical protein